MEEQPLTLPYEMMHHLDLAILKINRFQVHKFKNLLLIRLHSARRLVLIGLSSASVNTNKTQSHRTMGGVKKNTRPLKRCAKPWVLKKGHGWFVNNDDGNGSTRSRFGLLFLLEGANFMLKTFMMTGKALGMLKAEVNCMAP